MSSSSSGRSSAAAGRGGLSGSPGVGIAFVLIGACCWSTGGVALKSMTLHPVAIAACRALIAGLFLAPFLPRLRWRWDWRLVLLLGGYTGMVVCFTTAIRLTSAANAIALVYTAPAWVYGLTCLAERRIAWRTLPPVALILAGLGCIMAEPSSGSNALGNGLALVAGLAYGVFTFLVPRLNQSPIGLVSLCNLSAATLLFTFVPGALPWGGIPWPDWALLIFTGIFQIALGHVFFMAALTRIHATQASILALAEPLLNPIWVLIFLGEVPSPYGIAGLAVILSGVLADVWLRRGTPARATA